MQIDIQASDFPFPLTLNLRSHIKRRLAFALSSKDEHIQRVVVRLSDVDDPRSWSDKCCRIQVILANFPDVVIKDTQADLYAAIDRATDRAGRTVGRRLARDQP